MIDQPTPEALSETELEILRLVATGATNREIARARGISEATVKKHVTNINLKLGSGNRTEAVRRALELGLVTVKGPGEEGEEAGDDLAAHREAARALSEELERTRRRTRHLVRWFAGTGLVALAAVLALAWLWLRGAPPANPPATPAPTVVAATPVPPIWSPGLRLPSPRSGLALVAEPGGSGAVYAIAGRGEAGVLSDTLRYDPRRLAWEPLAGKPTAVQGVSAVAVQGQLVVPGGCRADGSAVDSTEVFDVVAGAWRDGPRLPRPVCAYALAEMDGQLYLFGGRQRLDGPAERWVWRLRLGDAAWTELPEAMPLPRAEAAAVAWASQDEIHVLGGVDAGGPQANHWLFRPFQPASPWLTEGGPPLPEGRAGLGAAYSEADEPTLYVTSGGWERAVSPWALKLGAGQWLAAPDLRLAAPQKGAPLTVIVTRDGQWLATAGGEADGRLLDQYNLLELDRYYTINIVVPVPR